ncbi:hypothetical protein MA689_001890 [Salmonella enterica]|nr:hypothetical protein [Salmonella enterica subsp. enterica serovar Oranienburg]EDE6683046.1 hypothetical protein [Salmonella enterica subsp. enterica serovar Apeyeme]EHE7038317.1 hypothetical protein [Salmonella enterica subsp. enterica serovar Newport]EIN5301998.1 hypothetical protein [Salmonella enterica]EGM6953702.1 hypothetical protein [Salmonella enterica subsp. enterica serovar Oranienburg]
MSRWLITYRDSLYRKDQHAYNHLAPPHRGIHRNQHRLLLADNKWQAQKGPLAAAFWSKTIIS